MDRALNGRIRLHFIEEILFCLAHVLAELVITDGKNEIIELALAIEDVKRLVCVCAPKKIPVIAGEEGICKGCGVATLSISYYDLGYATGKMAVKILKDGADISTMPIGYAETQTPKYNKAACDALGITPLEGYVAIE